MKQKKRKWIDFLIKSVVLIAALSFAYVKLTKADDTKTVLSSLPDYWSENSHLLLFVLLLIPLNWGIEAWKWRFVLRKTYRISFVKAFMSVFSGVSVGLFTPNRIGEFGGRILYLPPEKRAKGSVLSLISSYSQFFTTLLFGIPAFLIFLLTFHETSASIVSNATLMGLSVMLAVILMFIYFRLTWIYALLIRIPFLKQHASVIKPIRDVPTFDLLNLLFLSILRYAVFVMQFYLVCDFFDVEIGFLEVLLSAANLYFFMSLLPMFTIGEPGLRASLTAIFFGAFTLQIAAVISASVLLWIVNVLFVSILGALFLLTQKIINYENPTRT
jgi:uncharacterized membrane protein YbhN (UPF0104 family)